MKRNIKLILEYDGTNYFGWQRQKNAITIQETLEKAISNLTCEKIEVIGSSRTDAGVHAKGFTADFFTESKIPANKFKYAINNKLPKDIVVLESSEVSLSFHARYNCKGKRYVYKILNREMPPALNRNYVYHFKGNLDVFKMNEACKCLIGTHDFSSFKNSGSSVKTSVRTITELSVYKENDIIKIVVAADGFLYNMVRIIVGTLLDVGNGKINPECMEFILNSKDRLKAGRSVPPQGLCLDEVFY